MALSPGTPGLLSRGVGGASIGLFLASNIAVTHSLAGLSLFGCLAAGVLVGGLLALTPIDAVFHSDAIETLGDWLVGIAGLGCFVATLALWLGQLAD